jgi:hypothetical protein
MMKMMTVQCEFLDARAFYWDLGGQVADKVGLKFGTY